MDPMYTIHMQCAEYNRPGSFITDILAVVTHRYPVEHLIQDNKDTYKAVIVIFDQTQRKVRKLQTNWINLQDGTYNSIQCSETKNLYSIDR